MSTVLEHSANATATVEYTPRRKYGQVPAWIKERQVERYYKSMGEYYSECLSELKLPKRFVEEELHAKLMASLKAFLRRDKDFTTLISRLTQNYPSFPMDNRSASEYVIGLKDLSARVATAGLNLNKQLSWDALNSQVPFIVFSDLYLGNYTISYFHDYRAKMTETHFRRNHFFIRERTNLRKRKTALERYFGKIRPVEEMFKTLLKAQFKLWLIIALTNYDSSKEFPQNPQYSIPHEVDQKQLQQLTKQQVENLEKVRHCLYDLDPSIFSQTIYPHLPTEALWKNLVLIGATQ